MPRTSEGGDRQGGGDVAWPAGLRATRSDIHTFSDACAAVTDEYIAQAVGIVGHEVGGKGGKGDEATVRRDHSDVACVVRLFSVRPQTDPLGGTARLCWRGDGNRN